MDNIRGDLNEIASKLQHKYSWEVDQINDQLYLWILKTTLRSELNVLMTIDSQNVYLFANCSVFNEDLWIEIEQVLAKYMVIPFFYNVGSISNNGCSLAKMMERLSTILRTKKHSFIVVWYGTLDDPRVHTLNEQETKQFVSNISFNDTGVVVDSLDFSSNSALKDFLSSKINEGIWFVNWKFIFDKNCQDNELNFNQKYMVFKEWEFRVNSVQNERLFIQILANGIHSWNLSHNIPDRVLFYKGSDNPISLTDLLYIYYLKEELQNMIENKAQNYIHNDLDKINIGCLFNFSKCIWVLVNYSREQRIELFENFNLQIGTLYGPNLATDISNCLSKSIVIPQEVNDENIIKRKAPLESLNIRLENKSSAAYGIVDALSLITISSMFKKLKSLKIGMIFSIIINKNFYNLLSFENPKVEYLELVCNLKSWGDSFWDNRLVFSKGKGEDLFASESHWHAYCVYMLLILTRFIYSLKQLKIVTSDDNTSFSQFLNILLKDFKINSKK